MTQTALAAICGFSVRSVQYWEAGKKLPHPVTQEAILRKLNVTTEARQ